MRAQQARRIGAQPEEGRVAERDNAGIAEDQVQRQREQAGNQDLAAEDQVVRQQEEDRHRHKPEDDFGRMPAAIGQAVAQGGRRLGGVIGTQHGFHARLPNSPAGKATSSTTIIA
ncbi:hypothetical protein D3C81_875160 [compost metagenome]